MTAETYEPVARRNAGRWLLHRWPTALGLLAGGAALAANVGRASLSITVCVAVLCYLGAAALGRKWIAWVGVFAASLVPVAAALTGLPWWVGMAVVAAALVVLGLVLGVPRRPLTAQSLATLAYGGLAVTALLLAPTVGLVLAGAVLVAHGLWDVVHYVRDAVVSRSLAEFCVALDVLLGGGVLVLAAVG